MAIFLTVLIIMAVVATYARVQERLIERYEKEEGNHYD